VYYENFFTREFIIIVFYKQQMKILLIFIIIYFVRSEYYNGDIKLIIDSIWEKSQNQFQDSNKTSRDRLNLYHNQNLILTKYYDLISGEIEIYHGNVYNRHNLESHKLNEPQYVYYQRIWDVIDYYNSLNPKSVYGNYKYYVFLYTGYYADFFKIFINYPNNELKLQIIDHHYNEPLEYHFLFRFNIQKYLNDKNK